MDGSVARHRRPPTTIHRPSAVRSGSDDTAEEYDRSTGAVGRMSPIGRVGPTAGTIRLLTTEFRLRRDERSNVHPKIIHHPAQRSAVLAQMSNSPAAHFQMC